MTRVSFAMLNVIVLVTGLMAQETIHVKQVREETDSETGCRDHRYDPDMRMHCMFNYTQVVGTIGNATYELESASVKNLRYLEVGQDYQVSNVNQSKKTLDVTVQGKKHQETIHFAIVSVKEK
jgi:hypothetical protein